MFKADDCEPSAFSYDYVTVTAAVFFTITTNAINTPINNLPMSKVIRIANTTHKIHLFAAVKKYTKKHR